MAVVGMPPHKQLMLGVSNKELPLVSWCEGMCDLIVIGSSHDDDGSYGLILAQCTCSNPQAHLLRLNTAEGDSEWKSVPPMTDIHRCSSVITSGPFVFALNLSTTLHEYDDQQRKWKMSYCPFSTGNNLLQQYDTRARSEWSSVPESSEDIREMKQLLSAGDGKIVAVFVKHLSWDYGLLYMRSYNANEGSWSARFGTVNVSLCVQLDAPPLTLLGDGKLVMFRWYGFSGHSTLSLWDESLQTWTEIEGELPRSDRYHEEGERHTCTALYSVAAGTSRSRSSVYAVCEDQSVWRGDFKTCFRRGIKVEWNQVQVTQQLWEEGLASTPRLHHKDSKVKFVAARSLQDQLPKFIDFVPAGVQE